MLCTQVGFDIAETINFFEQYFKRPLTNKEHAKLRLTNAVTNLYYGMAYCKPVLLNDTVCSLSKDEFLYHLKQEIPDYQIDMSSETPYASLVNKYDLQSIFNLFVLGSNMLAHFHAYIKSDTFTNDCNTVSNGTISP